MIFLKKLKNKSLKLLNNNQNQKIMNSADIENSTLSKCEKNKTKNSYIVEH